MFCNRCEGEFFIQKTSLEMGPVIGTSGIHTTWTIWQCLECGLTKLVRKDAQRKDISINENS